MRFFFFLAWLLIGSLGTRAQQVTLTDSNLPLVLIDTRGQQIVDNPKIPARLRVIAHPAGQRNAVTDSATDYDGWIGIEVRGSSSQGFPKLSYGLELWSDSLGTRKPDSALCGMPPEHDWVLNASYSDKTLLRNALTYHLARQMGQWAARVVPCEVVLNGQYAGVFLLMEKVKRDAARVAVPKLNSTDSAGNRLTGGYIIKVDKDVGAGGSGWTSAVPPVGATQGQRIDFLYDYPKDGAITAPQRAYIRAYVDSFETALQGPLFQSAAFGYARYANPASFADFLLLNEVSRNVDGYRISTYLHKGRRTGSGGGKLVMGPVWDYDIAWHNANYCNGELTTGWAWQFNQVCGGDNWLVPFWWARLTQDSAFNTLTRCRWEALRAPNQPLATPRITAWIDSMASVLNEAQARNFRLWPILGQYVWPNPQPIPTSYAGEIASLKTWLTTRLTWVGRNLPGTCPAAPSAAARVFAGVETATLWPNPVVRGAGAQLTFSLSRPAVVAVEVVDAIGRRVSKSAPVRQPADYPLTLPVPAVAVAGLYAVRLLVDGAPLIVRRLVVE